MNSIPWRLVKVSTYDPILLPWFPRIILIRQRLRAYCVTAGVDSSIAIRYDVVWRNGTSIGTRRVLGSMKGCRTMVGFECQRLRSCRLSSWFRPQGEGYKASTAGQASSGTHRMVMSSTLLDPTSKPNLVEYQAKSS